MTKDKMDDSHPVSIRISTDEMKAIKPVARLGTFCGDLVTDFYKVKLNESKKLGNSAIATPDGSLIYTAHSDKMVLINVKEGESVKAIQMDPKSASKLVLQLCSAINSII